MRSCQRRSSGGEQVALDLACGGRAGARLALVVHGEQGMTSMRTTVAHLGVEHQVIAPTHPRWATTTATNAVAAVAALARAHLEVLAQVGGSDVVVVAASLGAWVGARMALDDAEGRIGALVLIGPLGAVVPGHKVCLPATTGAAGGHGRGSSALSRAAALRGRSGAGAHDPMLLGRLGAVGVPALVVWGGRDRVADGGYARAWADALGGGELVVIDGGGHLPCHRVPGATFAAIDTFLSAPLTFTT